MSILDGLNLMYVKGLPEYLQNDVDQYIKGYDNDESLLDCYYCELQASINIAEQEEAISLYHGNWLRHNLLGLDLSFMKGNPHFDPADYEDFL